MAPQGPYVLVTVTLPRGATLSDAIREYGLTADDVDETYGVVLVEPDRGTHVMMVSESAAARITGTDAARGPFANPKIEPYGPPQPGPADDGQG
ncbi:hypothetical protein [Streptomyces sp. NPDC005017]|uniref:hypothetical protein n=1 Tax=Streptomyces sp. NPDC005017 TaxID=3364706 RepID=UPI0036C082A8